MELEKNNEVENSNDDIEVMEDEINNKAMEDEINNVKTICYDSEHQVADPEVGMLFANVNEMFEYYKNYGEKKGFSVLRRTCKKGKDGAKKYVTFGCGRSGTSKSTSSNVLKPPPKQSTGCKARIVGSLVSNERWRLNSLILDHNHGLSPSKSRFFRCNREISSHVKRQLEINDKAGIRPNKSYNSFVVEAGGHANMSFLEKDCRNYIEKARRLRLGEGDAKAIQDYFMKMQSQNAGFYFSMDLDEEGRLKNVFWADSRSRAAYKEFGEVITFDTTYLTNKYDMPFAPFVGVNHHGQSTLFGCGLISSEDTESFVWLFQTWLACMSDCAPNGIITDQDRAMAKAIEIVFPNCRHRWCLWHIMKKFPEKLGAYKHYKSISFALCEAVYDSQSPIEFEESWSVIVEKYTLYSNKWLSGLFNDTQNILDPIATRSKGAPPSKRKKSTVCKKQKKKKLNLKDSQTTGPSPGQMTNVIPTQESIATAGSQNMRGINFGASSSQYPTLSFNNTNMTLLWGVTPGAGACTVGVGSQLQDPQYQFWNDPYGMQVMPNYGSEMMVELPINVSQVQGDGTPNTRYA